jgi:hypothetical protein
MLDRSAAALPPAGGLARWKDIALDGLEPLFQGEGQRAQNQDRIAELERMFGRLTMELDISRKPPRDSRSAG